MKNTKKFSGFSLVEMMVVLLIVAVVMAATAPMVSKKMSKGVGTESNPWMWLGNDGSMGYNIGNRDVGALIGASTDGLSSNHAKLYIKTDGTKKPHMILKNGNMLPLYLTYTSKGSFIASNDTDSLDADHVILIGQGARANNTTGGGAIAIGTVANATTTQTSSSGPIAIGHHSTANDHLALAIGQFAQATNNVAVAIGYDTKASGWAGTAVGVSANASGGNSTVYGNGANSSAEGALSVGYGANTSGANSVSIGRGANASGANAITLGYNAQSNTSGATAIGYNSASTGSNTLAMGYSAQATGTNSTAIGYTAKVSGFNSTAVGHLANVTSNQSSAFGHGSNASGGTGSVAIGVNATSSARDAIAFGTSLKATAVQSLTIGHESQSTAVNSVSIGHWAKATATNSIALGANSTTSGANSVAIGHGATTNSGANSVAIGIGSKANGTFASSLGWNSEANGEGAVALGTNLKAKAGALALGTSGNASGNKSIAIGHSASATKHCAVAIGGYRPQATGNFSIAIGTSTDDEDAAQQTKATAANSIAIGTYAQALHSYSTAIGFNAKTTRARELVLGDVLTTVSIPGKLSVSNFNNVKINGTLDLTAAQLKLPRQNGSAVSRNLFYDASFYVHGSSSDRRLKNVGKAFQGGLEQIRKLEVFNYTFKSDKNKTPRVGVMAQDLQKIFPDAVIKGEDGFLMIRMEDMFYALVNAVKELDAKVTAVTEQVKSNIDVVAKLQEKVLVQEKEIQELKKQNADFEKRLAKLERKK